MDIEAIREYCLSFPYVSENIQWGNDLVFKVAGRIFTVLVLDNSSPHKLSFKCSPEKFAELINEENIIPAPYMARNHWVALTRLDAIESTELKHLLRLSYEMILAKLPKKLQQELQETKG